MIHEHQDDHGEYEPRVLYWCRNPDDYSMRALAHNDRNACKEEIALLSVQSVSFIPELSTDFLLPRFPLTAGVKVKWLVSSQLAEKLKLSVLMADEQDFSAEVPLIPYERDDEVSLFKACLFPPRPGTFSIRVDLRYAERSFCLERRTVHITEPRMYEKWTLGPMLHLVDDALYLGNVAAAANPKGKNGIGILESHNINAVLNAAEERDPGPALLASGIRYLQIPFKDFSHNPMNTGQILEAVGWIHDQIIKQRTVLVHCHAGIGRSGSLLVAYLMLFREPQKDFDEVVADIQNRLRDKGHAIYPHLNLPETIDDLRRRMFNSGDHCSYAPEPVTRIFSVCFHTLTIGSLAPYLTPTDRGIFDVACDTPIVVRVVVQYEGMPPRGVYVFTNLNQDGPAFERIPMIKTADNESVYEALLMPLRTGQAFWLTAFAMPRKFDHQLTAVWIGQDLHFNVGEVE